MRMGIYWIENQKFLCTCIHNAIEIYTDYAYLHNIYLYYIFIPYDSGQYGTVQYVVVITITTSLNKT